MDLTLRSADTFTANFGDLYTLWAFSVLFTDDSSETKVLLSRGRSSRLGLCAACCSLLRHRQGRAFICTVQATPLQREFTHLSGLGVSELTLREGKALLPDRYLASTSAV